MAARMLNIVDMITIISGPVRKSAEVFGFLSFFFLSLGWAPSGAEDGIIVLTMPET
jgi:hypothetical protein